MIIKRLLLVSCCGLLLFCSSVFARDVVRLANGEWPPYHSRKLEHFGIASRIITEAFQKAGIRVEYQFLPWKRGMYMAKTGKLDGTAVWRRKPSFEEDFYYSDPIIESQAVFFHLKSLPFDWKSFNDLKHLNIGGTIGYGYNDDYTEAEKSPEFNINRAKTDELNFKMLFARHIDIFPITTEVGYFILRQNFAPEETQFITHHPLSLTPEHERPLHLLLSKNTKNARTIVRFNQGLAKLKKENKVEQYLKEFYQAESRLY